MIEKKGKAYKLININDKRWIEKEIRLIEYKINIDMCRDEYII
jgi:hypothetical protein